ncbi:heterokaryon incompatibility protein-domain-containing protein [Colletotrichum lupini]|nr:heterokaryon incompatibility protein-domain-containing protein [Colletotrichum lupini]
MPLKNMSYFFMTCPLTERTLDCNSNMSTDTTFLCSICKQVVQPTSSDSTPSRLITPRDQTLDAFRKAVSRDCFICSKLWNLSELHRIGWESLDPQLWRPLSFRVDKEYYKGQLHQIRVMVIYRDPTQIHSERITDLRFRLIPSSESEYSELFSFDNIDESTGSSETLDLAHSWFQACLQGHDQCKRLPTLAVNWLPTRLVDIGSEGETNWRLVITSEDSELKHCQPPPQYMTLSYRWGTEAQKVLLSSHNLELLRHGSLIVQLPQTFQDLVIVAHRLDIRYVWVDCLCIIQDSRSDWEKEALTMRDVYTNASCNIAASASSSPAGGLFRSRVAKDIRPGIVMSKLASQEPREFYMFDKGYWDRHLLQGALHTRGWVFQERFLSPRQVYFTRSQIMWEYLEEHKCEGFPRGVPLHKSSKSIRRLLSSRENDNEAKVEGLMTFDALGLWTDIVATYSNCQFSFKEDKLYALGGIAKVFQKVTGDTYLAGLWRSRLLHQLDWYTLMPQPRITSRYRAPSWSWVSVDGPVQPSHPAKGYNFLAEVMDANVTATSEGGDLVNVIGGSITLRAKVYDATYERKKPT